MPSGKMHLDDRFGSICSRCVGRERRLFAREMVTRVRPPSDDDRFSLDLNGFVFAVPEWPGHFRTTPKADIRLQRDALS